MSLCYIFTSCKKEEINTLEIRVQNATPLKISKINISGGDGEMEFESLPAGFTTGFRSAGNINLPKLQCTIYIEGQQQPFTSTNEGILYSKPGQYTCQISYFDAIPTIKFTREQNDLGIILPSYLSTNQRGLLSAFQFFSTLTFHCFLSGSKKL